MITTETMRLLQEAEEVMVRTSRHPCVEELRDMGIGIRSMDHHYQSGGSMEEVYDSIASEVMEAAGESGEVYYATPGHPLLAERTVQILMRGDVEVRLHGAVSFLDAVLSGLGLDPVEGLLLLDGDRLVERGCRILDPRVDTLLTQVDSRLKASEVKLVLLEIYPPEHPVRVVSEAGADEETSLEISLVDLDRSEHFGHLTTIFMPAMEDAHILDFQRLLDVVARLRGPGGCPWDRKQTHESLARHMVEEAHEAVDAIHHGDMEHLSEELGDLLLQVVLHAQLGSEEGTFDMRDTLRLIIEKLIRRHPHVFGDITLETPEEVIARWEHIKAEERGEPSVLDGVAEGLPALLYSYKLQSRAARIGFDWGRAEEVLPKLEEEIEELKEVLDGGGGDLEEELGDTLFSVVNLCRHLGADPEIALRRSARKFFDRFRAMEADCREAGLNMDDMTLEELDRMWEASKENEERSG